MAPIDPATTVRVALLGADPALSRQLVGELRGFGVSICADTRISAVSRSLAREADVLLVCLHNAADEDFDALDRIAETRVASMVFFDALVLDRPTIARLIEKLYAAAIESRCAVEQGSPATLLPAPASGRFPVWVLGASFGGPAMLHRFLGTICEVPRASFIVVQHIGEGFAEVLAQQLHRGTPLTVVCCAPGMPLRAGRVYVAPIGRRLLIDQQARFQFGDHYGADTLYRPSIDAVMDTVASRFGTWSGGIVFSGMGEDGALGLRRIRAAGGMAWAQDETSSTMASMPQSAWNTGVVTHRGTPEALATDLLARVCAACGPAEATA